MSKNIAIVVAATALVASAGASFAQSTTSPIALDTIDVQGEGKGLPPTYAGGQVARGGQMGLLGNKDFMDTPFTTSNYTEELIRNQQAQSLGGLLNVVDPSFRDSTGLSNRYDAYTVRGFRLMNDDVAVNGLYGLLGKYLIRTEPIERVEVLKGPSALLNGMSPRGSTAGNINIVTKRAGDEPLTRLITDYTSNSRLGAHVDVGRRFGDNKEWGVRFNGAYREGDPDIRYQRTRNGVASLGVDYRSERFRASADIIYQNDYIRAPERGYYFAPGVSLPTVPKPGTNTSQPNHYSDSNNILGMVRAEYDLTERTTVFAAIGAGKFKYSKLDYLAGTYVINNRGDATVIPVLQNGEASTWSGEAGFRTKFETGPVSHTLSVVGSSLGQSQELGQTTYGGFSTNIYSPVLMTAALPVTDTYSKKKSQDLSMSSVAVADTASIANGFLQITAGARYQSVASNAFSGKTGLQTTHYDANAVTPMAAVVIRPNSMLSFYGSYIEGLSQGPIAPSNTVNSGQIFAPYKTQQYEVGTKVDFGRMAVTLSAYQITVPSGVTDPTTGIFGVDGEQRNRGIELSWFGEVTRGFKLLGGITAMEGKLTKTAGHLNDGNWAVGVPRFQSSVRAEWDIPNLEGVTLIGQVIYTGSRYVDTANKMLAPSWTRFDAGLRYATKIAERPVTFNLNVTNLFDTNYWETNPTSYAQVGPGRTVWLSAAVDF
ncbi:TonB-dependent receptor (plasmid) [Nitrobacteraceae bacterium UC4449_H16]